ncbi:unnamed protein product [Staurois parvus]|uniref:Uncharacterized protein n=1 Tax=Staurois parvus TaxID=386267 RepID=A0ABN9EH55_9NEOB|nr:unnamed protein product [Staurois parvus]
MLLPGPKVSHGAPLYGPPLLRSPSPHSAIVPLQGLLTLLLCFNFFVIGCWQLMGASY